MTANTPDLPVPVASLLERLGWTRGEGDRGVLTWSAEVVKEGSATKQQAWVRWVGESVAAQLYVRNPAGPSQLLNLQWEVSPFGNARLLNCRDVHGVLDVDRGVRQFHDAVAALGRPAFLSEGSRSRPVPA